MEDFGEIAYEAYCKSSGNKSLISGEELPPWNALPLNIKTAWRSVADAICKTYEGD